MKFEVVPTKEEMEWVFERFNEEKKLMFKTTLPEDELMIRSLCRKCCLRQKLLGKERGFYYLIGHAEKMFVQKQFSEMLNTEITVCTS